MEDTWQQIQRIIASRQEMIKGISFLERGQAEEEGGCGVTGFACSIPVSGQHIIEPSRQMHNRGNGKGGGIAAVGLCPEDLGISAELLQEDYLLQIAFIDESIRFQLEENFIKPYLEIHHAEKIPTLHDYREVEGLEVKPPTVYRYFARVKKEILEKFQERNFLVDLPGRQAEDEFIYQNSFQINKQFYSNSPEKKAFVLSHGRNMLILKIVGYAEQAAQYYKLNNLRAHIWIAHQRYPTKGKIWHPGGAHPFSGMHEALVHNGDFANYQAICEYLYQYNLTPLFLTDTEVAVLLFDLWNRVYGYPLEYIIEAMAPTTELDFDYLPPEKKRIYREIQFRHIHGSPDGPWFFIIARNIPTQRIFQLIGITDTAMLRPQVFALSTGEVQIGLICSEKQAIDATLASLAKEDSRFHRVADKYWNARGGSHTDGGAFIFTIQDGENGSAGKKLLCTNKFGKTLRFPEDQISWDHKIRGLSAKEGEVLKIEVFEKLRLGKEETFFNYFNPRVKDWDYDYFYRFVKEISQLSKVGDGLRIIGIKILTLFLDRQYDPGKKRRSCLQEILLAELEEILSSIPEIDAGPGAMMGRINWEKRTALRKKKESEEILVVDAGAFPAEGKESLANLLSRAFNLGWKNFIVYNCRGQRFIGCGFGPQTEGVRIDVYGSSGDYLGSGIDGMEIYVHGNAQDQLGQIMKSGKMVIYGDVGQTFLYGAKGGTVYVLGNAAGRPLINAVGRPRVVINGTCLDYLAESFMAGDPLHGGGFVVVNGLEFDEHGNIQEQTTPYPGSNLFSLAAGGAIYIRDPHFLLQDEQLNGGEFVSLTEQDWQLVLPYLQENEAIFGISVEHDLLTVKGEKRKPEHIYRKVRPGKIFALAGTGNQE
ncbi:MAG: glutamate synthase [Thermodesulfobacteriota bacterium]